MLNWIIWNKTVLTLTLCIAQSAGAVEYTGFTSANKCPVYNTKQWWSSSDAWASENAEYLFIVIAPRSTLDRNGNTLGPYLWVE